jgi:hypothetical protein
MASEILDILVILDRSGSMQTGRTDHEGGLKSFVRDQRGLPGDVRLTFTQFDSHEPCEVVVDRVPIADVKDDDIQLIPRGGTPLFAGIGAGLAHLQERQKQQPAGQTIAMVVTDGGDTGQNGEWTRQSVRDRIKDLEAQGWTFIYLAANVDAFGEAAAVGVGYATNYNPSTVGSTAALYNTISNKVAGVRTMRASGMSIPQSGTAMFFTAEEQENIKVGSSVTFDGGAATVAAVLGAIDANAQVKTETTTMTDKKE